MLKKIVATGWSWLWVSVFVLALDRYAKIWVATHLSLYEELQILPFFNFTLAYNKGAAFSFLNSAAGWQTMFFTALASVVSGVIIVWLYKLPAKAKWLNIALCLVLAGAIGNAWDRLMYGYVIDFLDFHWGDWHFAIFNIADSAICVGAVMLCIHWMFLDKHG